MKKLLFLLPILAITILLAGCGTKTVVVEEPTLTAEELFSQVTWVVDTWVVVPEVRNFLSQVEFEAQPTKLAGNYSGNGAILRAWANNNVKTIDIPADLIDGKIIFEFAKISKYDNIPGNLQLSIDGKNLCNGRLSNKSASMDLDNNTYIYNLSDVSTQDKPDWVDLTKALWKTLSIKAWVGENWNRLVSVTIEGTY